MDNLKKITKLFLIIALCNGFILGFSTYGAKAFYSFYTKKEAFAAGTSIGPVPIEGLSNQQAASMLENKIKKWRKNTQITLAYKEKKMEFNPERLHFMIPESIESAVDGKDSPILVNLEKKDLLDELGLISTDLDEKTVDFERLMQYLINTSSNLESTSTIVPLREFLLSGNKDVIISRSNVSTNNLPYKAKDFIDKFSLITIPAQSSFSLLDYVKEHRAEEAPASFLSLMASGIYKAILPTNFVIKERNIGQEISPYAEPGFEALINRETRFDFVFANPNMTDYTLDLKWREEGLTVTLLGESFFYSYRISVENKQEYTRKTIKQYSPYLAGGEKKIINEGKNGVSIDIYRELYEGSKLLDRILLSEDYYAPVPRVEVYALPSAKALPEILDSSDTPEEKDDLSLPELIVDEEIQKEAQIVDEAISDEDETIEDKENEGNN